jgi:ubiquinone/menaquinone biosynthesis C-methylase UbiE
MNQAAMMHPITHRLFVDAGIGPGMRVLDLGCGVGDVSLLLADLVGPTGEVVGVDRDARSLELARGRAGGASHVSFVEADLADLAFEREFDACVGRYILMHLPDPIPTIRMAARSVRPGGIVAFQDSDLTRVEPTAWPETPLVRRCAEALDRATVLSGIERHMAYRYRSFFIAAELPEPELRMDTLLGGGPNFPGYHVFAETFRSLLPMMERFGVATAAEFEIDTLADRIRDEIVANDAVLSFPPQATAWARLPR